MSRAAKGEGSVVKAGAGYRGYVTVNGKRKYTKVVATKALASQEKRALLNQRDNGELSTGRVPTLKAWLDHWLTISTHRASTETGYRYYIDHYIDPVLGDRKIDKLTMEDLERFYAGMASRNLSGATMHQCHAIIRVALKQAVLRGKVTRNVAALVQAPSIQKKARPIFSEADIAAIFAAADGNPLEARWHLGLTQGLRPGEAIAVEWADVDLEAGTIRVHQQLQQILGKGLVLVPLPKTKAGDRVILLPAYAVELLRARRNQQMAEMTQNGNRWRAWEWEGQPRSLIFTQENGNPVPPRLDTTNWKRLLSAAGLPDASRYTARHTAASIMLADGGDLATTSATMGHASVAFTLATYVHPIDERKVQMAARQQAKVPAHLADKVQDKVQATEAMGRD